MERALVGGWLLFFCTLDHCHIALSLQQLLFSSHGSGGVSILYHDFHNSHIQDVREYPEILANLRFKLMSDLSDATESQKQH